MTALWTGILLAVIIAFGMQACQTNDKPTGYNEEYTFETGDPAPQPWGAQIFCDENPDECGY